MTPMLTRLVAVVTLTSATIVSPSLADGLGRPVCSKVERRAKAQLKRGLRACAQRTTVAACGTSQWARYRAGLLRKGCPEPGGATVRRPSVVAVRSSGGSAGKLAAADAAAIAAYRGLEPVAQRIRKAVSVLPRGGDYAAGKAAVAPVVPQMEGAFEDVLEKEANLVDVETTFWSHFATDWSLPSVIGEPLAAAMEELQIETRRLLGPTFSTDVGALRGARGCQGDLVRERLLAAYGEAVVDPAADDTTAVRALDRLAAELACLGAEQTDALDFALYRAYAKVAARLERAGSRPSVRRSRASWRRSCCSCSTP